jgi:hypothetical protein
MKVNKYINIDPAIDRQLSRTAHALLLPLILISNVHNEINKKRFIKTVGWITDRRTWEKYWKELEEKDILVRLDQTTWMLSPNECYADGASQAALLHKWNEARNATAAD